MSRFDIGALVCVLLIAIGFNVKSCRGERAAQDEARKNREYLAKYNSAIAFGDSMTAVAKTYSDSANYWKGVALAATPLLDSTEHWLQRNRAQLPTAAARDLKKIITWQNAH